MQQITGIQDMPACRFTGRRGVASLQRPMDAIVLPANAIGITAKTPQRARQHTVNRIEVTVVEQLTERAHQQVMTRLSNQHVKLQICLGSLQRGIAPCGQASITLTHSPVLLSQHIQFNIAGTLGGKPGSLAFQRGARLKDLQLKVDIISMPLKRQLKMLLQQIGTTAAFALTGFDDTNGSQSRKRLTHGTT